MKNKIICLVLCVVCLAFSMVLLVDTIEKDAPVINRGEKKEEQKVPDLPPAHSGFEEVELTDAGISAFALRTEAFVDRLAYGAGGKDYSAECAYIVQNADRIATHFTEKGNKNGAAYMKCVADSFAIMKEGFVSDVEFGKAVGKILKDFDSASNKIANSENKSFYPVFDTEIGGNLTLAYLSAYNYAVEEKLSDTETYTITVGGTALLGDRLGAEDVGFKKAFDNAEYSFPLYKLSAVLENDDASAITLLSPLTESLNSEVLDPVKGLPEYVKGLVGVDFVSLAPDEVLDYGVEGHEDTEKALSEVGITVSENNGGTPVNTDFGKVVYITLDLTDEEVSIAGRDRSIDKIKRNVQAERENGANLVVVMLHWNTRKRVSNEFSADYLGTATSPYEPHFDAFNKDIARAAIDAGADLVVGSGAHVLQGIELWKDKYIVYNPGNLSYPLKLDSEQANTAYSFLFSQTFVKDGGKVKTLSSRVIPIVNTSASEPYAPTPVFDKKADEIVGILTYQSSYFTNKITEFNYIKIEK